MITRPKKALKITVGVVGLLSILLVTLHWHMQKRGEKLALLQTASNVIVSDVPPKWIASFPRSIRQYFAKGFSINIDFNPDNTVNLFSNSSDNNTKINLKDFIAIVADIAKINELKINIKEDDSLYSADDIFKLASPQKIFLTAERITLKKQPSNSLRCTELSINADSVSIDFIKAIALNKSLQKLSIQTRIGLNRQHLEPLVNLRSLKFLDFSSLRCAPQDLNFLKSLKDLIHLGLGTNPDSILQKNNQQSIGKHYDISTRPDLIINLPNLKTLDAFILLTKDNLNTLKKASCVPRMYCELPTVIDDAYLNQLEFFLNKIPANEEIFRQGIVDKLNLSGQKSVTDRSLPFLKKYTPQNLDFRGSGLKNIEVIPFDKANEIHITKALYKSELIPLLKNTEYQLLNFSQSSFNDTDLKKLLRQTKVRSLLIEKTAVGENGLFSLINFYNSSPNELLKVSFGASEILSNSQEDFLKRVHRWGMLEVFSSHLDQRINFPSWASHTSKKIIHDHPGKLKNLNYYFPQLRNLTFYGKPLKLEEWQELSKLTHLKSLTLHSQQNATLLNKSEQIKKLSFLEIYRAPVGTITLTDNLETCQITLEAEDKLEQAISFQKGSPETLTVDGCGQFNLNCLRDAHKLKTLIIGPKVKVSGTFPALINLQFLESQSPLTKSSLRSIEDLVSLQTLCGNFTELDKKTLLEWSSLKQLKNLDLSQSLLQSSELTVLKELASLSSLKLPAHDLIAEGSMKYLKEINSLQKIDLDGTLLPSQIAYKYYQQIDIWDFLP